MANIIIAGVKIPFVSGGQEALIKSLAQQISLLGHDVDVVEIPFSVSPKVEIPSQLAMWRSIKMDSFAGKKVDLLICTKFPSYYLNHHCKSVWMVHQYREMYDLFGGRYSDFSDDARDEQLRRMLMQADSKTLTEAKYLSGISKNVVDRMQEFNRLKAEVLHPPLPLGNKYYKDEAQPYILSVGRLCSIKRVDLMIKAMPQLDAGIKLKIVGSANENGIMDYYKNEIAKHHIQERVEFLGRVSDQELLDLYAKATAVYYAPQDEDYGYVTLEAMASSKAVIAAKDSGGVLEFVEHDKTGLVQSPDVDSIAIAANRLFREPGLAKALGENGRKMVEDRGLNSAAWEKVTSGLLSPLKASLTASGPHETSLMTPLKEL
jgi:glycosyltransferase involved in cell wall biosynthesis